METRVTGDDIASRYKVARALRTNKAIKVAFGLKTIYKKAVVFKQPKVAFRLETIYKKDGLFKQPKAFKSDNASDFKNGMSKLYEKYNIKVWITTAKHKHIHTAVVEYWRENSIIWNIDVNNLSVNLLQILLFLPSTKF